MAATVSRSTPGGEATVAGLSEFLGEEPEEGYITGASDSPPPPEDIWEW